MAQSIPPAESWRHQRNGTTFPENCDTLDHQARGIALQDKKELIQALLPSKKNNDYILNTQSLENLNKINTHPSMQQFGSPKMAIQEALGSLQKRFDLHLVPTNRLIELLIDMLCSGFLRIEQIQIRIEELKLATLREVFLYWVQLHDANFGHTHNQKLFLDALALQIPHLPFLQRVGECFYFEQRHPNLLTAFCLIDGQYRRLTSFASVQRAFASIAAGLEEHSSLLQQLIVSPAFFRFLLQFCTSYYPDISLEAMESHDRFQLPVYPGEGILALCKHFDIFPQSDVLMATSPLQFMIRLNQLVQEKGARKILFIGGPLFDLERTPLFDKPAAQFWDAIQGLLHEKGHMVKTEKIGPNHSDLCTIIPDEQISTKTPFEIAQRLYKEGDDILSLLNLVERSLGRPQTIAIADFADGGRLVGKMDFDSGNLVLAKLSARTLQHVPFGQFKLAKVVLKG